VLNPILHQAREDRVATHLIKLSLLGLILALKCGGDDIIHILDSLENTLTTITLTSITQLTGLK